MALIYNQDFLSNDKYLVSHTKERQYIQDWEQIFPDYKILHWHDQLPEFKEMLNKSRYMRDCYKRKIWAIFSDALRAYVLYTYGGIYLDTDIKVSKNFDALLNEKCFMAVFAPNQKIEEQAHFFTEPAIAGSVKNGMFMRELLELYQLDIWYKNPVTGIQEMANALIYKLYEESDLLKRSTEYS